MKISDVYGLLTLLDSQAEVTELAITMKGAATTAFTQLAVPVSTMKDLQVCSGVGLVIDGDHATLTLTGSTPDQQETLAVDGDSEEIVADS